jgi:hypothetical protein
MRWGRLVAALCTAAPDAAAAAITDACVRAITD